MSLSTRWLKSWMTYLLAFVLVSGAVLPSPWVWQCHHASRIVIGPVAASSMPCRMDMGAMQGNMPCCPPAVDMAVKQQLPPNHATISEPNCHPTLAETAQPAAQLTEAQSRVQIASLLAATDIGYATPALAFPLTTPQLRRPPPSLALLASFRLHTLAPRAPPIA